MMSAIGFSCPSTVPWRKASCIWVKFMLTGFAPSVRKMSAKIGIPTTRIFRPWKSSGQAARPLRVGHLPETVLPPGDWNDAFLLDELENALAWLARLHGIMSGVVRKHEGQAE